MCHTKNHELGIVEKLLVTGQQDFKLGHEAAVKMFFKLLGEGSRPYGVVG